MKKIFNLIVWISSLSILLLACSKESENEKDPNEDDDNMVVVSLAMTGDILEIEETPLSRTVERADIYGVQIYSSLKDEDKYKPYGYGIFIDKSKIQVKLFKDRKYKFEMTVFPDGKYNGSISYTGYKTVFVEHESITDSIRYSENDYLKHLDESYVSLYGSDYLNRLNTDRYYGKLVDYIPIENGNANIEMKRVVAGLTFKIANLLENCSLMIDIEYAQPIEIKGSENHLTYQCLIGLKGEEADEEEAGGRYTDKWFENPIDEVPFKFTWTNGERTESFAQTVTLKRKMNYTFQITIPETFLVSNRITVTEEDNTWDDEVAVDNIYFGDLTIENEEDLRAFKDAAYTKVTGNLIFRYWNCDIFNGYDNLKSIGGNMKFIATEKCSFNDLHDFNLGRRLKSIGGNFEMIATIPKCFCNLNCFKGFEPKIGGNFRLVGTTGSFTDLYSIYSGITEIGGAFEIITSDSDSFDRFQGIENDNRLKKIGGDIILKNLPAFQNYCDLTTVLQDHTGQFIVSGNAYNPTKEQILNGECSLNN